MKDARTRNRRRRVPIDQADGAKTAAERKPDAEHLRGASVECAKRQAFGAWLLANEGALPADFELGV